MEGRDDSEFFPAILAAPFVIRFCGSGIEEGCRGQESRSLFIDVISQEAE
jgi:hypothetical protein